MFTIGCDPEVFLQDNNGNVISAIGKIGGSKRKPRKIDDTTGMFYPTGFFAVQEDNVALEYNTPACGDMLGWAHAHMFINKQIDKELALQGLKRHIVPAISFPESQLQHPRAWIFGCDPDFDAWDLKINPKPQSEDRFLRSAGGHIHIGYDNPNKIQSIEIARLLDLYMSLPFLVAEEPNDRLKLYGKAGAIRFKPFGLEYRTPSNFWTSSPALVNWVYSTVKTVMTLVVGGKTKVSQEVQEVYNSQDKVGAKTLMEKNGVFPCKL